MSRTPRQPEPSAAIRRRGFLLVLSSPSGAGKTTITRRLVQRDRSLSLSVSVTTRPPRPGEVNGRDYFFVDQDRFNEMIAAGEFLEHAFVFGHHYGTPRAPIEEAISKGRDVVTDVDWQGAQQLVEALPYDITTIFILPPSTQELEARLRTRAQDSEAIVAERMAKAAEEMSHWSEYDYVIINRNIEDSVAESEAIVAAERLRRARQPGLADLVGQLRRPARSSTRASAGAVIDRPLTSTVSAVASIGIEHRANAGEVSHAPVVVTPTIYGGVQTGTVIVTNLVVINTDTEDFRRFSENIGSLLEQLRSSNEISPDMRQQLRGELRAGMELLKTPKPERGALQVYLLNPLQFIARGFSSASIRALATSALTAISRWLGVG